MKFLIDVNTSRGLGNLLIEQGHDVVFVRDTNPTMDDEDILSWAIEENRIIVTTDKDFEQLIWQQKKKHSGILRLENLPRKERMLLLEETMKLCSQFLKQGGIVIATQSKFRIRGNFRNS